MLQSDKEPNHLTRDGDRVEKKEEKRGEINIHVTESR